MERSAILLSRHHLIYLAPYMGCMITKFNTLGTAS